MKRWTRRALLGATAAGVAARAIGPGVSARDAGRGRATASRLPTRMDPPVRRPEWVISDIGRSVLGRPIERWDLVPDGARRRITVVCGVHGDERAGRMFAESCVGIERPDDVHLTIIPEMNPDGWALGTRRNANDVDLNRNFPWRWKAKESAGPRPASEPETRRLMELLIDEHHDLAVFVHQPLDYVATLPNTDRRYARDWALLAGVPVGDFLVQDGGAETWADLTARVPSMLIEIGGTRTRPVNVAGHLLGLEHVLRVAAPS